MNDAGFVALRGPRINTMFWLCIKCERRRRRRRQNVAEEGEREEE